MPTQQGFPQLDTPISDPETGQLSLVWFRFFIALWNRTGASVGNNSANFLFPSSTGSNGQVLTSAGPAKATFWSTLVTKLSQLTNDTGFITNDALAGFSTADQTNAAIAQFAFENASTTIPPADSTYGAVGTSIHAARGDHSHPREHNPIFSGSVGVGTVTWTSGTGAPNKVQPNGSLYSRADGGTGTRLYVSNGATWAAVAGV